MAEKETRATLPESPPPPFKSGYVAIVGRPNVGKSTLLNQLLKFKLSIISPKPQTTRRRVLGILNGQGYQIIFLDTPGMIEPRYDLQRMMMKYVRQAVADADVVVYLVDASWKVHQPEAVARELEGIDKPVLLAINKIDQVRKDTLLPLIESYRQAFPFRAIVPISALKDDGLDRLLDEIITYLPVGHPYYPTDYITDQEERFFVAEIIREKIFHLYGEEIPYSTHVEIEEFKERPGKKDYIRAVIYVEKSSQKGILIGKGGRALKRVGELAREEIEQFLGRPVFLELFVKVMEDWRKNLSRLRWLGYR